MSTFSKVIIGEIDVLVESYQIKSDFYRALGDIFKNNQSMFLSTVLITNSSSSIYHLTVSNVYYEEVKDLEDYLYGYQLAWEKNNE
ncbi:hypothetical protein [Leuconostoc gasicomitatum]|uniref:hypothetical protein n=1 Tax=Leuconostoc gasicomitatum TaxID=115778 RepID=UPI001CC80D3C|nr:hypothetical protein [Leuconostoc gasicomitatum]MBZ5958160.1 hypothetical protein [Leuconostoc gasicomitatum]